MSKKAFQEYLDLCTDALVQTAAKEKTNYQTINKCYYTYIVLNSLNVSETKIERITAESLKGGHGILEKRRIPTKANGAGQSIYSMSVKEYLEKNFRYDSVFEFAENKIEYLSHNGTFSKSDIEYISVFFDALAKGENTVSFWTTMIKELFEAIQKDYLSAGSSLGKSYSLYMMAEISAFFVEFNDIFNGAGINHDMGHNQSNNHGVDNLVKALKDENFKHGFSFTNLVDFDALYGHRRNPHGYRDCLEEFDARIPEIIENMREDDLLMITADHGNDPTYAGTDHTREYIPLLIFGESLSGHGHIPVGHFADISATVAENFGVDKAMIGESFLDKLV